MRSAVGILLLCSCSMHALASDLPVPVQRVMDAHGIASDQVSLLVQAIEEDEPLLSHEPDAQRNPASVMKLVTTWAALEILGPAYRWKTELHFLGDFDGRTLDGDLGIKGYGDPFLVSEELWKLLGALRRTGLEDIRGDLVLDSSYFDGSEPDPALFDGQPFRTYNVPPSALLLNFKSVYFQFFAEPQSGEVRIAMNPELPNLDVRNQIKLASGPCRGFQRGISFQVPDADTADRVIFAGAFPESCGHYGFSRTVLQHDTYAFGLFEVLWRQWGGRLRGHHRSEVVPETSEPALTWHSPPLGDVIRRINKNSNNVMTRQLLYTLGAERFGPPGTREKGIEAVVEHLTTVGFDPRSLIIDNGAGLSREARISASLLGRILKAAHASPYAPEFVSSLSLAGLDGTMRSRFSARPERGRMHVKTGRLDDVSAVAGYLRARNGRTYAVVAMVNARDAHRGPGEELQDALLGWVYGLP